MSSSPVICLEKKLIHSPAWRSLRGASMQVYLIFRTKCQMEEIKMPGKPHRRRPEWRIKNNGLIEFSYKSARRDFGITEPRFVRAIDQLISRGFLDITESGMGIHKVPTRYAISERWLRYDKSDFKRKVREKPPFNFGFKKKPTDGNVGCLTDGNVSCGTILVLRTGRNGKVRENTYKLSKSKWLCEKTA